MHHVKPSNAHLGPTPKGMRKTVGLTGCGEVWNVIDELLHRGQIWTDGRGIKSGQCPYTLSIKETGGWVHQKLAMMGRLESAVFGGFGQPLGAFALQVEAMALGHTSHPRLTSGGVSMTDSCQWPQC